MHALKLLSPKSNLAFDGQPLLLFNLFQLVRFDYDFSVQLINLRVNNFVRDRINRPKFYIVFLYVQQLREFLVAEVCLVRVERANLHVALLQQNFCFGQAFAFH
jgi:hypothetical protein